MRAYSELNLIEEDYKIMDGSIFEKLLTAANKKVSVKMDLQIPKELYIRGQYFCNDVMDIAEKNFNQNNLLNFVFENDFLYRCKKNPNPKQIYNELVRIERKELVKTSEATLLIEKDKEEISSLMRIKMKRKTALRGEVLLWDLEEVLPNHEYTLEKLLIMLYCDFVEKVKKSDSKKYVDWIVESLF